MEAAQNPYLLSKIYTRFVFVFIVLCFIFPVASFVKLVSAKEDGKIFRTDFDVFYTVGLMANEGDYDKSYKKATLQPKEYARGLPEGRFVSWSYPPTFGLIAKILGCMDLITAYISFLIVTSLFFFAIFIKSAKEYWQTIIFCLMGIVLVNFNTGQNGFLTGGLVCLFGYLLPRKPKLAGAALGLMVIKPHLVLGIGLYLLFTRQTKVLISTLLTAFALCALSALVFGPQVWHSFIEGMRETSASLQDTDKFVYFRMITLYSFAKTLGLPHFVSIAIQAVSVTIAISLIWWGTRQKNLTAEQQLGFAILLSLLFSPYSFDYDLLILAAALALLMPTLARNNVSVFALAATCTYCGMAGYIHNAVFAYMSNDNPTLSREIFLSLQGPMLWVLTCVVWKSLRSSAEKSSTCNTDGRVIA